MEKAAPSDAEKRMLSATKDPAFQRVLADSVRELTGNVARSGFATSAEDVREAANGTAAAAATTLFGTLAHNGGPDGVDNLTKTLEILQRLGLDSGTAPKEARSSSDVPIAGDAAAAMEDASDDVIARMMEEFERMGNKDDFDKLVGNMMKQVLAKEIMYIPMKQITEKFPDWLGRNRDKLSADEYQQRGRQYQCFQQMVMLYETDPNNVGRLTALMQELQDFGMPPSEIVSELAPGLELTPDGTPTLPNIGVAGMPPLPFGKGEAPPCCIM